MIKINPVSVRTVREGELIVERVAQPNVHPSDWSWHPSPESFGIGWRMYCLQVDELYHEFGLTHKDIYERLNYINKPKRIKGEITFCNYGREKSGFHVGIRSYWANINEVCFLKFKDSETGKVFSVSNVNALDDVQPGEKCRAYFDFNPYGHNGDGWTARYINVFVGDYEINENYKQLDLWNAMERAIEPGNLQRSLAKLTERTGLKFV